MKIMNHHSKTKTISNLTVHSKLLQKYLLSAKQKYFVIDEVEAEYPKLGHTTLLHMFLSQNRSLALHWTNWL